MPRVSVIMNVRNGDRHLREAIDSVVAQTFTDWELILWDDHSIDDSARIIAGYRDPRFRYFEAPADTPLGPARKLAIRQADGDWLAFLDQDDVWLPDKLQKQMDCADVASDVGLVYGRTLAFSERKRERDFDHRHEFEALPEGDIFQQLFVDSCFISMSSAAIRRSILHEIAEIPDAFTVIPDYYLFVGVCRKSPARAVQEVICRYRIHDSNMSRSNSRRMQEEILQLIDLWSHDLDPGIAARRRRIHSTVLAWDEMHTWRTMARGAARLLRRGSVAFLLSRPFARAFRAARRRLREPYWVRNG